MRHRLHARTGRVRTSATWHTHRRMQRGPPDRARPLGLGVPLIELVEIRVRSRQARPAGVARRAGRFAVRRLARGLVGLGVPLIELVEIRVRSRQARPAGKCEIRVRSRQARPAGVARPAGRFAVRRLHAASWSRCSVDRACRDPGEVSTGSTSGDCSTGGKVEILRVGSRQARPAGLLDQRGSLDQRGRHWPAGASCLSDTRGSRRNRSARRRSTPRGGCPAPECRRRP